MERNGVAGTTEVGYILGWDRRKVATYYQRGLLPEPLARLSAGLIWNADHIREWKKVLAMNLDTDTQRQIAKLFGNYGFLVELPDDRVDGLARLKKVLPPRWKAFVGKPPEGVTWDQTVRIDLVESHTGRRSVVYDLAIYREEE